ncbi:MAG: glutamine amidotransferase [Deltaproteobacteria bacterium]|jgi:CobQ-like glutamine amidotransferase family enzyme|nr:glutamine amidotransferase [Deltaproteobacteria bacterium]
MKKFELTAVDLYPEIMNIYGDRGNILYFKYRCSVYGIEIKIINITVGKNYKYKEECESADIFFMGGGQDAEQALIYEDFFSGKKNILMESLNKNKIMLAICGGYQLLCDYYKSSDGKIMKGISVFKGYTESGTPRLTGNIAVKSGGTILIGFENHGGRTYLDSNQDCMGTVLKGYGNNGKDKTEGARTGNFFGTYLHGSFLPKNFVFCDYLIGLALQNKYGVNLWEAMEINGMKADEIDDNFEIKARKDVRDLKRFF